jgi:lactoylglutathione lyase
MRPSRLLHTMLRVGNLQRSLDFYVGVLGMQLLRREEYEEGRFTLAFLGYGGEQDHSVIELTYNWDADCYQLGTAFGHLAVAVEDIDEATAHAAVQGARIVRAAGPLKGKPSEIIAFLEDPDGYRIELIERRSAAAQ